jgi:glycosyltransferase involved in cell wall biosynthesis
MPPTISVVIPVYNGAAQLARCLAALRRSGFEPDETIVVDDGSTDDSARVAAAAGARVVALGSRGGPARARNAGAAAAAGDLLLFLDADVEAHPDALGRVAAAFEREPSLDALIGSYDAAPGEPNFISQYRNLLHYYVHQTGRRATFTFWGACGAVRREVFLGHGGFDERYDRPCIEDIELGCRMALAGRRLVLDRDVQVKHLKRWTLGSMLRTDLFDRGIPWTELILASRRLPDDLNLRTGQRASVALAYAAAALALLPAASPWPPLLAAALALSAVVALNRGFYLFLARERGLRFAAAAVPLHLCYFYSSGLALLAGCGLHFRKWAAAGRRGARVSKGV